MVTIFQAQQGTWISAGFMTGEATIQNLDGDDYIFVQIGSSAPAADALGFSLAPREILKVTDDTGDSLFLRAVDADGSDVAVHINAILGGGGGPLG